ncbi:MAG: ComEC/Rec2 family competence protein [Alphaproteobacteria bacterium]
MAVDAAQMTVPSRRLLRGAGAPVRRFGAALAAERDRWPLWSPVLFGAGIAVYFGLPAQPPHWAAPLCFGIALAAFLLLARRRHAALSAILAAVLLAGGFLAADIRTAVVTAPILARAVGPATVTGRIVAIEDLTTGPRILLDRVEISGLPAEGTPERVRLRLHRGSEAEIGMRIAVLARLDPPPEPSAPGAYDFRMQAWFAGIGGVGFALGKPRALAADPSGGFRDEAATGLAALRRAIGARIRAVLPGDVGAVAVALIVGERSAIAPATMDAIRISGLAHLLSISGLHMGLVAGTIFFTVRAFLALFEGLALRRPIKKYAAAAAMLGAALYLALSGATVPTQRSFMMTMLVLTAVLLDREAISMRLVAWAAMIVLCLSPESLLGPSFQMSFAAVVALVALYEGVRLRHLFGVGAGLSWWRRGALYLAGVGLTTLVAGAATSLYGLHHFGELAHYSVVANLIAVPLCAVWIMPWAVLGSLLMPLGLEAVGLVPMGWGVDAVLWAARTVAGWPGASTQLPLIPGWGIVAATLGGLWLCLWRRRWRYWGIGGLALGILSLAAVPRPDILIAGSGKLIGLRLDERTLAVSTLRAERYAAEIWMRELGLTDIRAWSSLDPTVAACDSLGCVLQHKGRRIAVAFTPDALADDCSAADAAISTEPVRTPCPSAHLLIDRFDLWRNGAHAVRLDDLSVETVRARAGDWPWTAPAQRGRSEDREDAEEGEGQ